MLASGTGSDIAEYRVIERTPLETTFHGARVLYSCDRAVATRPAVADAVVEPHAPISVFGEHDPRKACQRRLELSEPLLVSQLGTEECRAASEPSRGDWVLP